MIKRKSHILLILYQAAGYIFSPFVFIFLAIRVFRGKEDKKRLNERYGKSQMARPQGPLIWIHAASLGEMNSIIPFIRMQKKNNLNILLTTGTKTSGQMASRILKNNVIHQYLPLDILPFVRRFIDHWKPDLAIFTESEMWPAMLNYVQTKDIPIALINARLSQKSYQRWLQAQPAIEALLANVNLCCSQTKEHADMYRALGVRYVVETGNLKYDVPPLEVDPGQLDRLKKVTRHRPIWIAASTHKGEEEIIARVHATLAKRLPHILTVIVPRHPERAGQIMHSVKAHDISIAQRSLGELPSRDTGIYIADTLGEMGLFYRLSNVIFVGGSFVPVGGHNPIEPARLSNAIIHGPYTENFKPIYEALDDNCGGLAVEDPADLAVTVLRLLSKPDAAIKIGELAKRSLEPFSGPLNLTIEALMPFTEPLSIVANINNRNNAST